ncbi:MAG TPA: hypothetical protein VL691_06600 [Vicinamibacteria bacterium]|nr:hypothetical protein [Vicinamibacteria bacterium]
MRIDRRSCSKNYLAAAGLGLALLACGDSGSVTATPTPTPTPAPTPTPTPATTIIQGQEPLSAPVAVGGSRVVKWDLTTPSDGTLDVTISYVYDNSKIHVWVTDRVCSQNQFANDECTYLIRSIDGPRPRTAEAAGVKAGTYSLFVANDGPNDEQIGYLVTLTSSASASGRLTVGPPAHFTRP